MALEVQDQTNFMRINFIIAILSLSLSSYAQDHPFYSINDPKIKENLNKVKKNLDSMEVPNKLIDSLKSLKQDEKSVQQI